jgi:predicted transposase/invertase (TIGR01784 family)
LTYYAAKLLIEQLGESEQYADLKPSISICLLDAVMFREEQMLQHAFQLRTTGGFSLTDCLQVHIFELPKYVVPSDSEAITDPVEQWLYFFRRAANLTPEELHHRLPDPVFAEATGVLEMIARNPEERQLYEDRLKAERDEWARTAQAKLDGLEEGMEKGLEKGMEEGMKKGLRRGQIIGKIELLCELLNQPYAGQYPLTEQTAEQLASLEAELQRRLRERT